MKDVLDLINAIEAGEQSVDVLAALIPTMVKQRHSQLPELLGYMIIKPMWPRWGYPGPGEYFNAIGVPHRLLRQAEMVVLECAVSNPAYAKALGPKVVNIILGLKASYPEMMSERDFASWMWGMAAAVA